MPARQSTRLPNTTAKVSLLQVELFEGRRAESAIVGTHSEVRKQFEPRVDHGRLASLPTRSIGRLVGHRSMLNDEVWRSPHLQRKRWSCCVWCRHANRGLPLPLPITQMYQHAHGRCQVCACSSLSALSTTLLQHVYIKGAELRRGFGCVLIYTGSL